MYELHVRGLRDDFFNDFRAHGLFTRSDSSSFNAPTRATRKYQGPPGGQIESSRTQIVFVFSPPKVLATGGRKPCVGDSRKSVERRANFILR